MRISISPDPIYISCAHRLTHVPDGHKCGRLHGHTYTIRVWVSCHERCFIAGKCRAEGLDSPVQWVMDFGDLIAILRDQMHALLDHSDLNETIPNPTAENICRWAWPRIAGALPAHVRLDALELLEGVHACKVTREGGP